VPANKKTTWLEKLHDSKDLPKVVQLNEKGKIHWKAETCAIPSPMEVNDIMALVPDGKLITMDQIRNFIAKKHNADIGCPLTCGIFAWIAANASKESHENNPDENLIPYWRTLNTKGELNPKYPGGIEEQKKRLEHEGHRIIQKGKKFYVDNYKEKIFLL